MTGHPQIMTRESDKWHVSNPIAPVYLWFKPLSSAAAYLNAPEESNAAPFRFD
jgi:hypothetical protein